MKKINNVNGDRAKNKSKHLIVSQIVDDEFIFDTVVPSDRSWLTREYDSLNGVLRKIQNYVG